MATARDTMASMEGPKVVLLPLWFWCFAAQAMLCAPAICYPIHALGSWPSPSEGWQLSMLQQARSRYQHRAEQHSKAKQGLRKCRDCIWGLRHQWGQAGGGGAGLSGAADVAQSTGARVSHLPARWRTLVTTSACSLAS